MQIVELFVNKRVFVNYMVLHGLNTWSSSDDRPARPLVSGSLVVSSFSGGAHVLMYLKLREDVSSFTSQSWSYITSDSFHAQLGYLPLTWVCMVAGICMFHVCVYICICAYVCIWTYMYMYTKKTKKNTKECRCSWGISPSPECVHVCMYYM